MGAIKAWESFSCEPVCVVRASLLAVGALLVVRLGGVLAAGGVHVLRCVLMFLRRRTLVFIVLEYYMQVLR